MTERLTATQEEMLATLRRLERSPTFGELIHDVRQRELAGCAHRATVTDMQSLVREWFQLEAMGRVRRVPKDNTRWELVPRVEFIEDGETNG